jgi:HSP20 family molecular chaperone IbpA
VHIHRTEADGIARELQRLNEAISQRASELYLENRHPSLLDNWLAAEQQLVRRPPVELSEHDREIEVRVGLDGFEPHDIEVQVALQALLIRARAQGDSARRAPAHDGAEALGIVHLAHAIDMESVSAVFTDGQLRLTMSVSAETAAVGATG